MKKFDGFLNENLNVINDDIKLTDIEIKYLNKIISAFTDSFYGKYGYVDPKKNNIENFDVDVNGLLINTEYISKMGNNRAVFKHIARINKMINKNVFMNYIKNNLNDIYGVNGKYFMDVLGILIKCSDKGKFGEKYAFSYMKSLLKKKGIDVEIYPPANVIEDAVGIDGTFMYNNNKLTIQVKDFSEFTYDIKSKVVSFKSNGALSKKTNYLILYKKNSNGVYIVVLHSKQVDMTGNIFSVNINDIVSTNLPIDVRIGNELYDPKLNDFESYEFQKQFLDKEPENFIALDLIGINPQIRQEFDHLWSGRDMGIV